MRNLIYVLLSAILMSCLGFERVHFKAAQPEWRKPILQFPASVQGVYKNCKNNYESIKVTETQVLSLSKLEGQVGRNEMNLDSIVTLINEKREAFEEFLEEEDFDVTFKGDSVFFEHTNIDTVFEISDQGVLKKYKGDYFINYKNEKGYWNVEKANLSKGVIRIWHINPTDSLLNLSFVKPLDTEPSKASEYILEPNKKELKAFLKSDWFSNKGKCYTKVK